MLNSSRWMKSVHRLSLIALASGVICTSVRADSVVFNIGPDPSLTDSASACAGPNPGAGCQTKSGQIMTTSSASSTVGDLRNDYLAGSLALNSYSVYRSPNTAPYATAAMPAGCDRCQLSFDTGNLVSYNGASAVANNTDFQWIFGTGGLSGLSLTGEVFGASTLPIPALVTSAPLSASQKSPTTLTLANTGSANNYIEGDHGTLTMYFNLPAGSLNSGLLSGLGLTATDLVSKPLVAQLVLNFVSMGFGTSGHGVDYDVNGGRMLSYSAPLGDAKALSGSLLITPAPEPVSLVLVGSGLTIAGLLRRRRTGKA